MVLTDEEQKKVFSKNLNYYISMIGKQQKEVAKDLGISATTFNTWCVGKILPSVAKIQKLADYFNIGKSDLTDEKLDSDAAFDARLICDTETMQMIKNFYTLTDSDKIAVKQIIFSLSRNTEH